MSTESPQDTGANEVALPALVRLPMMVRVIDADGIQHEFGPVTVEIPEQTGEGLGSHWDKLANEESAACDALKEDMECWAYFPPLGETNAIAVAPPTQDPNEETK